ncbi:MAG: hypothetical protein QM482_05595 [Sulfurospirillum sp.]
MCIMHAPINRKTINVSNRDKTKKVRPSFNEDLLKPDPNFIDERKKVESTPQKRGFFAKILQ